ncbi:cysteine desulfurase activator complex subunit SufD [Proteus mirabilis]|uniref:Cysteine desulfurase activator complex subunit SufD n=1 Tax=Proteus mirabilis TaxID=584 RepID=A0A379GIU6_PROMI|nr:cysteine desulfurase activator complex subunit SufD [Proteus mirabilis]
MAGLLTLNEKREKQHQVEQRNQQALNNSLRYINSVKGKII